jgi:N-carbamoyl-L-amino-acid hydrolase
MQRLQSVLDGVNTFGRNPETGGFNRVGYSREDMAARRWFADRMSGDGLTVSCDAANNVFGRYGPSDGACVMVGSHLDTVPEGGAFDGVLGACVALECVCAMRDAELAPRIAIEVVATAEEEGRFGGMLGSQTIAGEVSREWIDHAVDADGIALTDAMRAQGLDPYAVLGSARPAAEVSAFLELHIEQGPLLEASSMPIGIAHSVSGVCSLAVRFEGRANHSGTTPMDLRADAFAGLAQVAHAIPAVISECGTDQSRITIGKVDLWPNVPHTIAGSADFTVIIRDTDEAVMQALTEGIRTETGRAADDHHLGVSLEQRTWLSPVRLDPGLATLLREEADRLELAAMTMPSGAGHDAQTMQRLCPSALIFVPSRGGISHAREEWTDWEDIEKGARLMLNAILRLSGAK